MQLNDQLICKYAFHAIYIHDFMIIDMIEYRHTNIQIIQNYIQ